MMKQEKITYYIFGNFHLDEKNKKLYENNTHIPLTQKSFEVLLFLVQNKGKLLTKNDFFVNVWENSFVDDTNLTQHIYRLRKTLSDNDESYIKTIPKQGYKFIAEVAVHTRNLNKSKSINLSSDDKKDLNPINTQADHLHNLESNSSKAKEKPEESQESKNDFTPNKIIFFRRVLITVIPLFLLVFFLLGYIYFSQKNTEPDNKIKSVAALPFSQIGEIQDEKIRIGIADAITTRLGEDQNLSVIPTESIKNYFNKNTAKSNQNIFKVGKNLHADVIILGAIQQDNETVRVSVKFYDVKSERPLCTTQFDKEFTDIFSLQDIISERVAKKLSLEIEEHLNSKEHNNKTSN